MKKILFLFIAASAILFASCGSDDKKEDPPVSSTQGKWEPTTIQLVKIAPLYTLDYPHTESCPKDYLEFTAASSAVFFRHETANCTVTEYANAFQQSGNNVSLNVLGYQINGTITAQTETSMEIQSDISAYIPIIKAQFPEYEQYLSLLEGGTVKLSFVKK
ncbi:hypothetical protein [Paenimyroides aestuarii]|uniref:Lipocalin-like domain-containing protein n=1 Tax=Paenimyroides aestuarii TaxID=2968490 RepID=A0ABY5NUX7_9FLAO|nr:hypothetical protein [Paenimyroides aestuarii]UUV22396.1 hypothetical protein NPX36_04980 [Paenimyroides aestuarii]